MRRLLLPLVLLLGLLIAPTHAQDITTGLVGHWTFNNTPNDATANNNHGTLVASPPYITGHVAQALSFNGTSQYVSVAASASLNALTAVTFAFWGNFSATPPSGRGLLEKTNSANTLDGYFLFTQANGVLRLTMRSDTNDRNADAPTNYLAGDSAWHHYAITWTGASPGGVQFYKDGSAVTTTDTGASIIGAPNDGALTMARSPLFNNFTAVSLDEVRIYNRALSAGDIAALFSTGTVVVHRRPVMIY